jgi:hypothetical protein
VSIQEVVLVLGFSSTEADEEVENFNFDLSTSSTSSEEEHTVFGKKGSSKIDFLTRDNVKVFLSFFFYAYSR